MFSLIFVAIFSIQNLIKNGLNLSGTLSEHEDIFICNLLDCLISTITKKLFTNKQILYF